MLYTPCITKTIEISLKLKLFKCSVFIFLSEEFTSENKKPRFYGLE